MTVSLQPFLTSQELKSFQDGALQSLQILVTWLAGLLGHPEQLCQSMQLHLRAIKHGSCSLEVTYRNHLYRLPNSQTVSALNI